MNNEDDKQKVATNFVHILEDHGENLRNQLYQQWLKGEHCDLAIKFKDGELNVHSAVLFAVSPTLGELPKKRSIRYLNMPDMELSHLDPLIKMAYTGVLCVELPYAEGVAMAARRLGMKDICLAIRGYLDQFQKDHISADNPVSESAPIVNSDNKKRSRKTVIKRGQTVTKVPKLSLAKSKLSSKNKKRKSSSNQKPSPESDTDRRVVRDENFQNSPGCENKEMAWSSQNAIKTEEIENQSEERNNENPVKFIHGGSESESGEFEDDSSSGFEMTVKDSDLDLKTQNKETQKAVTEKGNLDENEKKGTIYDTSGLTTASKATTAPSLTKLAYFEGRRSRAKRQRRNEDGKLKCPGCSAMFDVETDLRKHIESEEAHLLFRCPECELSYIRKSNLTRHMRTAHSKEFHLKCRYCDSIANTEKELREHCKTQHDNVNPFECDKPNCTYKTYKYDFLRRHLQIHSVNREFVCDKCGKTFSQHNGLSSHRRTCYHLQEYLCDFCGQAFNHFQSMKSHRRTIHLGERPFICSECGSRFTDHRNLKRHKRIHENSFPYACEICGQKYRHSNSLKGHMKRHGDSYARIAVSVTHLESLGSAGRKEPASESLTFQHLYDQTFPSKPQELADASYPTNKTGIQNLNFTSIVELPAHKYPSSSVTQQMSPNFGGKDAELSSRGYQNNSSARTNYDKESDLPPSLYIPLYRAKPEGEGQTDVGQNNEYSLPSGDRNQNLDDLTNLCMTSNL